MKITITLIFFFFFFSISYSQSFTKLTLGDLANDNHRTGSSFWSDYDADGDLDLFLFGVGSYDVALMRNDCGGVFTQITDVNVGDFLDNYGGVAPAILADLNNDGFPELVLAQSGTGLDIYDNNGNSTFSKRTSGIFEIRLDDLAVGSYSYRIMKNNETVKSERLIVIQ